MADNIPRESGSLGVTRRVVIGTSAATAAASILPLAQRAETQQQFTRVETSQMVQVSATEAFQLACTLLLVFGLFACPVAFLLSGLIVFAYFIAHSSNGFFPVLNHGEAAMLYCFLFLYISATGPGIWSLDALQERKAGNGFIQPGDGDVM